MSANFAHDEAACMHLFMNVVARNGDVLDSVGDRVGFKDINAWLTIFINWSGADVNVSERHANELGNILSVYSTLNTAEGSTDCTVSRVQSYTFLMLVLQINCHSTKQGLLMMY